MPRDNGSAREFVAKAIEGRPELVVHEADPPSTVHPACDLLATCPTLFERGVPVAIILPADGGTPQAVPLTLTNVVMRVHELAQPVRISAKGVPVPTRFPDWAARSYLELKGEWGLPPLAGLTGAPLLGSDGSIRAARGYDRETGLWMVSAPKLDVPSKPTRDQAEASLDILRRTFCTFPFADADRRFDKRRGVDVVDLRTDPGQDESTFLAALLGAACRPSLPFVPGLLLTAPSINGAGTGKGLLTRSIAAIAYGSMPHAIAQGHDRHELDKRIVAELIGASPMLFLDNLNSTTLHSETLAQAMTERPARVRILGRSETMPLNAVVFVVVTGNGLLVSEDLVRRFIESKLDAQREDPEGRRFAPGFLDGIRERRAKLLSAVLTIWRWGRQNVNTITEGKPLGGFEEWAEWCRDPLLELGCCDPVERMSEMKQIDPRRRMVADFLRMWYRRYRESLVKASELDDVVLDILGPKESRKRQWVTAQIESFVNTRAGGYMLTRENREGKGKWAVMRYGVVKLSEEEGEPAKDISDRNA